MLHSHTRHNEEGEADGRRGILGERDVLKCIEAKSIFLFLEDELSLAESTTGPLCLRA